MNIKRIPANEVDVIVHTCALCGGIGIVHPGEPPSEIETNFRNRCQSHKLTGDTKSKSKGKQRGSEHTTLRRDPSRYCRFPFTTPDGRVVSYISGTRERLLAGEDPDEIAAEILAAHNVK